MIIKKMDGKTMVIHKKDRPKRKVKVPETAGGMGHGEKEAAANSGQPTGKRQCLPLLFR